MPFEPVIGLEVHAQLKTNTKIFCGCSTKFGEPPNSNTCPVCTGMPGVLPVLNKTAVSFAVTAALATNCRITRESRFDRKNYFYPDLPKGYQISQYAAPIAEHGWLEIETGAGVKKIGITRIHMEEDAGKLIHDPGRDRSMVDLNRAGVPLIEIVSEPDMRSASEAGEYLRKLHSILRYIDVCDGNMEQGSFRCDANISLRPEGQKKFGIRTELKNLNSFRNVEKAIEYEIIRQAGLLEEGGAVIQETRLWDPAKNKTVSMRGKEEAHDYRYFPDPDLVPLVVENAWIQELTSRMPELPDVKKNRFITEHALNEYDAGVLTATPELAEFYEKSSTSLNDKKLAANWIMTNLLGLLNQQNTSLAKAPVTPEAFGRLLEMLETGKINARAAKTMLDNMVQNGKDPETLVSELGIEPACDSETLETHITRILEKHPDEVAAFRGGKSKLLGFFMGQVMKQTRGTADPAEATRILKTKLQD